MIALFVIVVASALALSLFQQTSANRAVIRDGQTSINKLMEENAAVCPLKLRRKIERARNLDPVEIPAMLVGAFLWYLFIATSAYGLLTLKIDGVDLFVSALVPRLQNNIHDFVNTGLAIYLLYMIWSGIMHIKALGEQAKMFRDERDDIVKQVGLAVKRANLQYFPAP